MARHVTTRAGPASVQIRLQTCSTGEDYVTEQQWLRATLNCCPWHPGGGCGFCKHGTYPRVRPRGTLIPRWYCPVERRTVSALPDALASHYSGTLADIEAHVLATEQARSLEAAANDRCLAIELPAVLRYFNRLRRAVYATLTLCRALLPDRFSRVSATIGAFERVLSPEPVLMSLRPIVAAYLHQLPTPVGFNPSQDKSNTGLTRYPHQMGRDPPCAVLDPCP